MLSNAPSATPESALACLHAVRPAAYARTRNHLDGAVTGLSPYLTHGLLALPKVLDHLRTRHRLHPQHKLVFELGWRAYFRHVWQHDGEAILASRHDGPLPDGAYSRQLPADIREARTGLAVIDQAVRTLYATGLLHNHARMWLASYVVHLRKVHWRAGADWMVAHLLDGDLASNHLSWQWVAGTASRKPYLFNAEIVARYAPAHWAVPGSVLDCSYAELDRIARDREAVLPAGRAGGGVIEPALGAAAALAAAGGFAAPVAGVVAGREVWLVHPWSLADAPPKTGSDRLVVAVLDEDVHRRWPWSERRWSFVLPRMQALATLRWCGSATALRHALAAARSVTGTWDPHLGGAWRLPPDSGAGFSLTPAATGFPEPDRRCASFSSWWSRVSPLWPAVAGAGAADGQGQLFG